MAKKSETSPGYRCRDCKHSHSWYGENYKGEVFMCKCEKSEWSKILSQPACKDFHKR